MCDITQELGYLHCVYERGCDEPSNAVKSNSRCNSGKRLTYYYKFLIINAVCSEGNINFL